LAQVASLSLTKFLIASGALRLNAIGASEASKKSLRYPRDFIAIHSQNDGCRPKNVYPSMYTKTGGRKFNQGGCWRASLRTGDERRWAGLKALSIAVYHLISTNCPGSFAYAAKRHLSCESEGIKPGPIQPPERTRYAAPPCERPALACNISK
jgi:hypothetical protein